MSFFFSFGMEPAVSPASGHLGHTLTNNDWNIHNDSGWGRLNMNLWGDYSTRAEICAGRFDILSEVGMEFLGLRSELFYCFNKLRLRKLMLPAALSGTSRVLFTLLYYSKGIICKMRKIKQIMYKCANLHYMWLRRWVNITLDARC